MQLRQTRAHETYTGHCVALGIAFTLHDCTTWVICNNLLL